MLTVARSRRRDDRGFTLIELIVTVTILGIVIAALTESMILAMKVPPEAQEHTMQGWETARLTNFLSDDVANTVKKPADPPAPVDPYERKLTCDHANTAAWPLADFLGRGAGTRWNLLESYTWTDGNVARSALYLAVNAPVAATYPNTRAIEIHRWGTPGALLTGYCSTSSTDAVEVVQNDPNYGFILKLADTPDGTAKTLRLIAQKRV